MLEGARRGERFDADADDADAEAECIDILATGVLVPEVDEVLLGRLEVVAAAAAGTLLEVVLDDAGMEEALGPRLAAGAGAGILELFPSCCEPEAMGGGELGDLGKELECCGKSVPKEVAGKEIKGGVFGRRMMADGWDEVMGVT